jgi:hypothetical protein
MRCFRISFSRWRWIRKRYRSKVRWTVWIAKVEALWNGEQISMRKASKKAIPFCCLALIDIKLRAMSSRRKIKAGIG